MLFRTVPLPLAEGVETVEKLRKRVPPEARKSSKKHFSISIFEMTHETRTYTLQKSYWYPRVSKIEIEKRLY